MILLYQLFISIFVLISISSHNLDEASYIILFHFSFIITFKMLFAKFNMKYYLLFLLLIFLVNYLLWRY